MIDKRIRYPPCLIFRLGTYCERNTERVSTIVIAELKAELAHGRLKANEAADIERTALAIVLAKSVTARAAAGLVQPVAASRANSTARRARRDLAKLLSHRSDHEPDAVELLSVFT